MNFDLSTIDWTAIGSIVTFVAMIIAYWTILSSNTQNKANQQFQLLLMQRDIEQKRLDELIEGILVINDSIQPTIVLDFSHKLIKGTFSEADRHYMDGMGAQDKIDNNRLNLQLIKYDKKEAAKGVLQELSKLRQVYGEWLQDICLLNLYKNSQMYSPSTLKKKIRTMVKFSKQHLPDCDSQIEEILGEQCNDFYKAVKLMDIFSPAVSSYLVDKKHDFEKELFDFVRKEQKRIDNMIVGENK